MGVKIFKNAALSLCFLAVIVLLNIGTQDAYAAHAISVVNIKSCEALQSISDNLKGNYILSNDIDCTATNPQNTANHGSKWDNQGKGFLPIGLIEIPHQPALKKVFEGSLNGYGYKIIGLYINRPDLDGVGLFSEVQGGNVKNLTLKNAFVKGNQDVGALAGLAKTQLSKVHVEGIVLGNSKAVGGVVGTLKEGGSLDQSSAKVLVRAEGLAYVGGLVGANEGGISKSFSEGFISGATVLGGVVGLNAGNIADVYSNAGISVDYPNTNFDKAPSYFRAGGIVGFNTQANSVIQNVLFTGSIVKSIADNRYKQGALVGGYAGDEKQEAPLFKVVNSFWDSQVSGANEAYPGNASMGELSLALAVPLTFTGWDFNTVWIFNGASIYPQFKSQENEGTSAENLRSFALPLQRGNVGVGSQNPPKKNPPSKNHGDVDPKDCKNRGIVDRNKDDTCPADCTDSNGKNIHFDPCTFWTLDACFPNRDKRAQKASQYCRGSVKKGDVSIQ